ncbi:MAG: class I SAM-dependent methyltransferase [Sphingobium sp.]|nr:class I SAM-dependent methyltransferase [Sphingobium sp.]
MADVIDNEGVACRAAPVCALCGAAGTLLHEQQRDPLFGAPGIWDSRKCTNPACRIVWLDPMPLPDGLGALYQSYHTHEAHDDDGGVLEPFPYSRSHDGLKKLLAALLPPWRHLFETQLDQFAGLKPGRMLDVGCGAGLFLRQAIGAGWQATGIDFDAGAVAVAKRVRGAEAHAMDIHDPALDDRRFEGILLNNVIEHLPDPAGVMARCAELLTPGGRIVMITPNVEAMAHDIFGPDWRGLEPPRHLFLYTGSALVQLGREAGLSDVRAFCRRDATQLDFMCDASRDVARGRGREPSYDLDAIKRRYLRDWWWNDTHGEFLIFVAHKAR